MDKTATAFHEMTTSILEPLIPLPDPFDFPPLLGDDRRDNDGPFESTLYVAEFKGCSSGGGDKTVTNMSSTGLDKTKTFSVDGLLSDRLYSVPESTPLRKSLSAQDVRASNIVMKYLFSAKLPTVSCRFSSLDDLKTPEIRQNLEPSEWTKKFNEAVDLALQALISVEPIEIDFDWQYLTDEMTPTVSLEYLTISDEEVDDDSGFGLPKLRTSRHLLSDSISDDAISRYKAHRSSIRKDDESFTDHQLEATPIKNTGAKDATFEKTDVQEAPLIGNVKISLPKTSQDIRIKKNTGQLTVKKGPFKALVPLEEITKKVAPAAALPLAKTRVSAVLDKSTDSSFSGSLLLASSTPVKDAIPKATSLLPRNSFLNSAKRSKSVSSPRTSISKLPGARTQGPFKSALKRPSSAPSDVSGREALSTLATNTVKDTPKLRAKNLGPFPRSSIRGKENLSAATNRARAH